jgi:DNA-binding CsgD family transcriptional regulator
MINILGKPFCITDQLLQDLAFSMPNPANIKDACNGKYIFSNISNLGIYKMQRPSDILGLTLHDLDDFMRPHWGNGFVKKVDVIDNQVKQEVITIADKNRIFLDRNGFVHVQDMYKSPFIGKSGKAVAILTLSFDYTEKVDLLCLFNKYKELHESRNGAISHFVRYLKIDNFFYEGLTEKELLCLICAISSPLHRSIAQKLDVSTKTVETHIMNIASKLKEGNIQDVFMFLRGHHRNDDK